MKNLIITTLALSIAMPVMAKSTALLGGDRNKPFCADAKNMNFSQTYENYCGSQRYWSGNQICNDLELAQSEEAFMAYDRYCAFDPDYNYNENTIWSTGIDGHQQPAPEPDFYKVVDSAMKNAYGKIVSSIDCMGESDPNQCVWTMRSNEFINLLPQGTTAIAANDLPFDVMYGVRSFFDGRDFNCKGISSCSFNVNDDYIFNYDLVAAAMLRDGSYFVSYIGRGGEWGRPEGHIRYMVVTADGTILLNNQFNFL